MSDPTIDVLVLVRGERARQDAQWGEQNHRDGTGEASQRAESEMQKEACNAAFSSGEGSWAHILREEVAEALAESDPYRLRRELVQVAAVAVAWVEAIDRRLGGSS